MKDDLPFCYRTHPGSIADITTLHNMVSGLKARGAKCPRSFWTEVSSAQGTSRCWPNAK